MAFTTQPQAANVARYLGFASAPILHGEEKASQTFKKGAFLIDDDAGLITETTSALDASTVAHRCVGLALKDASGVTSADMPFVFLGSQVVIEITLSDNTAGVHTSAATDKWKVYAAAKGTNNWALDTNAASDTGGLLVIGFKKGVVVGTTTEARVYGIVTSTVRGGTNAGSAVF